MIIRVWAGRVSVDFFTTEGTLVLRQAYGIPRQAGVRALGSTIFIQSVLLQELVYRGENRLVRKTLFLF